MRANGIRISTVTGAAVSPRERWRGPRRNSSPHHRDRGHKEWWLGGAPVGVHQRHQPLRGFAQRVGSVLGGDAGQGGLAALAGVDVDGGGQVGEEPADGARMLGADRTGGLGGGHLGQYRRQWFPGDRGARAQVLSVIEAAAGVAAADAQPVGQRRSRRCSSTGLACALNCWVSR
jgi:hypothetical protein